MAPIKRSPQINHPLGYVTCLWLTHRPAFSFIGNISWSCCWHSQLTSFIEMHLLGYFIVSRVNASRESIKQISLQLDKKYTPPWVFFVFFKLRKWYQIVQSITYILLCWEERRLMIITVIKHRKPNNILTASTQFVRHLKKMRWIPLL